ncbi:MAG: hypothetical protein ACOY3Y_17295 [Acidobacteriota bacterium]
MSRILMSVASAVLAAAAVAQTPKELLELTRGEFDGLAATATIRFDGRDWSKSELVKELDRRAKAPGAIPRGKEVTIGAARARGGGALRATRSKGTSTFGPETISALKAWRPTDPPFIASPSGWGIETWWGEYCGDGNRYLASGTGFDGNLSAKLFGRFPGGSVSLGVVKVPPPPSVNLPGQAQSDPNLDYLELTMPCGISGVVEHRARLRIYANGVGSSDDVPIDFVPARLPAKAAPSWITQSIAATADANVKMTPGHGDAPAWFKDSFGAKHTDQNMAYGVDTFKVVVPGSCTLVGADLRWDTVNGQEAPGTWVIEKRRSLSGNTLEIELMWGTIGSGLVYGIAPKVTTIAGFPCA